MTCASAVHRAFFAVATTKVLLLCLYYKPTILQLQCWIAFSKASKQINHSEVKRDKNTKSYWLRQWFCYADVPKYFLILWYTLQSENNGKRNKGSENWKGPWAKRRRTLKKHQRKKECSKEKCITFWILFWKQKFAYLNIVVP